MTKQAFPQINVKAAAIAGAVIGVLVWLFDAGAGFGGMPMYGYMSGMLGYYGAGVGYAGSAVLYFIVPIICGAVVGVIAAWVYNQALRLE